MKHIAQKARLSLFPLLTLSAWVVIQVGVISFGGMSVALAAIDVYQFEEPEKEARFNRLIDELRCPKCQNQNVADSDAMIAKDIKTRVYEWVQEGRDEGDITAMLVDRYGDFVTYRPPFKPATLMLWVGPPLLFLVALMIIVWRVRKRAQLPTEHVSIDEAQVADVLQHIKKERQ